MAARDLWIAATIGALGGAGVVLAVYELGPEAAAQPGRGTNVTGNAGTRVPPEPARVERSEQPAPLDESLKPQGNEADSRSPRAQRELQRDVRKLADRLREVERQKQDLESRLDDARGRLEVLQAGGEPRLRNDFDLDEEDWKQLAENGTIKYRLPCSDPKWTPSQPQLDAMGLAPEDAELVRAAHERSQQRVWELLKPLCQAAAGSAEVAEILGANTCVHLVLGKHRAEGAPDAMREVAEVRAGLREPAPVEDQHPVTRMFLGLTEEMRRFEADLAESVGPDDARRIAWDEELCKSTSVFGGPGPRGSDGDPPAE